MHFRVIFAFSETFTYIRMFCIFRYFWISDDTLIGKNENAKQRGKKDTKINLSENTKQPKHPTIKSIPKCKKKKNTQWLTWNIRDTFDRRRRVLCCHRFPVYHVLVVDSSSLLFLRVGFGWQAKGSVFPIRIELFMVLTNRWYLVLETSLENVPSGIQKAMEQSEPSKWIIRTHLRLFIKSLLGVQVLRNLSFWPAVFRQYDGTIRWLQLLCM